MKFWRVYQEKPFRVHIQDCLTRVKAERVARDLDATEPRIEVLDIETMYPHFDAEDLETIRTNPIYQEQIGHLLPMLIAEKAFV